MEGYLHPLYAQSFSRIGEPVFLPMSKGWLIKRQIPGTPNYDGMGPYPLFFCENWDYLIPDLESLSEQLISLIMVINPDSGFPINEFKSYFDKFFPYKDHFLLDTHLPLDETTSKVSRYDARRALKDVTVDLQKSPKIDLDEWVALYDNLIKRHNITGIRTFSQEAFAKQIAIPNTHYFRALHNGEIVGGNLYIIQNDVAYGHLLALTPKGYELGASHAILWTAIQHLAKYVRLINFGGGTSINQENPSGLDKFKQGWSNTVSTSHFCGKILNKAVYNQLASQINIDNINWFPVYRTDDF
jgi:hypothetical protein